MPFRGQCFLAAARLVLGSAFSAWPFVHAGPCASAALGVPAARLAEAVLKAERAPHGRRFPSWKYFSQEKAGCTQEYVCVQPAFVFVCGICRHKGRGFLFASFLRPGQGKHALSEMSGMSGPAVLKYAHWTARPGERRRWPPVRQAGAAPLWRRSLHACAALCARCFSGTFCPFPACPVRADRTGRLRAAKKRRPPRQEGALMAARAGRFRAAAPTVPGFAGAGTAR